MIPKFRAWDKRYKMLMQVNQIDFEKRSVWLEADNGDHENRHTLTREFKDVVFMEYTGSGITDKEGKKYCQDDLVFWNGNVYRLIKGTYMFELDGFADGSQDSPRDFFSEDAWIHAEIVGNIYENPELLEVE